MTFRVPQGLKATWWLEIMELAFKFDYMENSTGYRLKQLERQLTQEGTCIAIPSFHC